LITSKDRIRTEREPRKYPARFAIVTDAQIQEFFSEFENGTPAPAVDPADIRRMWEFVSRVCEQYPDAGTAGDVCLRSVPLAEGICGPDTNLGAVWVRVGLVDILLRSGVLQPWTPGSDYEKRVFEVAAKFPTRMGSFDGEEFLRQVGEQR
jgi:hypothetical protein